MKLNLSRFALRLLLIVVAFFGLNVSSRATNARPPMARQAAARYVCPMHAEVTFRRPGSCPRCKMKLVAQKRRGAQAATPATPTQSQSAASIAERVRAFEQLAPSYEFTCLMHPEIHQAQEGVCPKCGMPLSTVKPSVRGAYRLDVVASPRRPKAGEVVRLNFIVTHPETGARVRDYVLNHERLFHLFIVSADMDEYQHLHPQLAPDGSFKVETTLPRAGLYKLHSDFFPVGGTLQVLHGELATAGYHPPRMTTRKTPARAALVADNSFTKTIDGMKINLDWGGGELVPGAFVRLKYALTDARTGEPVRDLEPYLGAWGHTLILNADQSDYLHSHPVESLPEGVAHATLRGGPEVEFGAMFPEAGLYRIWTQFQRGGRVSTVSFTISVRRVAS